VGEILVGRGHDAHIDRPTAVFAHPPDLPFLKGAKQLHLHGERNLPDLIEKERAAVGRFEKAHAVRRRAGKGSPGVAEELALEKSFADRPTVDGDERAVRAGGGFVHEPRDALLPRAALARDEHRRIHLGDDLREPDHVPHLRAAGDQVPGVLLHLGDSGEPSRPLPKLALGHLESIGDVLER